MLFYDSVKKELAQLEAEMEKIVPKEPQEVYNMIMPYIKRGGKRIRPVLTFLCCKAVGGEVKETIKAAAIIELFHNFTLIHDDIEDSSEMRRGVPTLHRQYGIPVALNSGDALYTIIWRAIASLETEKERKLPKLYAESFRRVVEGQGIELNWHGKNIFNISEKDYVAMIKGKTAALTGLSCELGAYLGGASMEQATALREFGEALGISFQIKDDILNVTGTFEKYKKEIGGDITEGKRTLMVVHALKNASQQEQEYLKKTLISKTNKKSDIEKVISIFESTDAIEYAAEKSREFKDEALKSLKSLKDSNEKNLLLELMKYVLEREE